MELVFYDGSHTGQEIDDGIDRALAPDTTATEDSEELITSGAVYTAVSNEASARNSAIQQAISAGKPAKMLATLAAANWVGSVYSFEGQYSSDEYDLTIAVADTATTTQYQAFTGAQITGSATENTITALNGAPTVDIPIVLTVEYIGAVN